MSKRSFFEQCALASGLLTPATDRRGPRRPARAAPRDGAEPGDQQLAERLVETGVLNAWQAKQLLDGRTKFTLGPYRIVDSIGQGGMGQVFKAEHARAGPHRGHQGPPPRQVHPRGHRQFHPRNPGPGQARSSPAGSRPGRGPRRQRLLPGDRVRARHRPAEAGPPRRPLEHGGRRPHHLPSGRGPPARPRARD